MSNLGKEKTGLTGYIISFILQVVKVNYRIIRKIKTPLSGFSINFYTLKCTVWSKNKLHSHLIKFFVRLQFKLRF